MKIISYTQFLVPPGWLFLKIETGEGLTGWGGPVIEGKAATVKTAVDELTENLTGITHYGGMKTAVWRNGNHAATERNFF